MVCNVSRWNPSGLERVLYLTTSPATTESATVRRERRISIFVLFLSHTFIILIKKREKERETQRESERGGGGEENDRECVTDYHQHGYTWGLSLNDEVCVQMAGGGEGVGVHRQDLERSEPKDFNKQNLTVRSRIENIAMMSFPLSRA